jgi:flagellar hook-associated protein 1 FlgK
MSLTLALRTALSGLNATQAALQVASDNIANASTPGYSRKTIELESRRILSQGAGVQTGEIQREVDAYVIRQLRDQRSVVGQYAVRDRFLQQIDNLFGSPENNRTISAEIGNLKNAFEALAVTPEFSANALDVANSARTLADQLNQLTTTTQDLRREADDEIARLVGIIDSKLENVAELNVLAIRATSLNQSTATLDDERDRLLGEIAEYLDIRVFDRTDGSVDVFTGSSRLLVSAGVAADITHSPITQASASISYLDPSDPDYPGGISGIFVDGSAAANDITNQITNGRLKGLIDLRDGDLPNLQSEIDLLAKSITEQINAAHNTGTAYPPPSSVTGTHAFNSADVFSATGSVRVAVIDQSDGSVIETSDIALGGFTTINDVVTAIDGLTNASASLNAAGQLVVTAGSAGYGIAINELDSAVAVVGAETRGLSHYLGLNDFFQARVSNSDYDTFSTARLTDSTSNVGVTGTLTFAANGVSTTVNYLATESIDDIAANINANGTLSGANITATVVDDGSGRRLVIQDVDQDNFLLTDSGNLTTNTGLTTDTTSRSTVLALRSDIRANPDLIARAELSSAGGLAPGDDGVTVGDASVANAIAGLLGADITFPATGGFSATTATLERYAASIVSIESAKAAEADEQLAFNKSFQTTLEARISSISGVNVDEELANLIVLEQSFNASARVLTTVSDMFDELFNAVR